MISGWFGNNGLWRILWDDDDLTQLVFDLKVLQEMMQNKEEQIKMIPCDFADPKCKV